MSPATCSGRSAGRKWPTGVEADARPARRFSGARGLLDCEEGVRVAPADEQRAVEGPQIALDGSEGVEVAQRVSEDRRDRVCLLALAEERVAVRDRDVGRISSRPSARPPREPPVRGRRHDLSPRRSRRTHTRAARGPAHAPARTLRASLNDFLALVTRSRQPETDELEPPRRLHAIHRCSRPPRPSLSIAAESLAPPPVPA